MCTSEKYKIDLKGMEADELHRHFVLDNEFFRLFADAAVEGGLVEAEATISKASGLFHVQLETKGEVQIPCDVCLEPMQQEVENSALLTVKLGSEDNYDEEIITVADYPGLLDLAWLLYEQVVLAIPIRHIHAPGKCNDAMTQKLNELSAARSSDEEAPKTIDPRWDKLKDLKLTDD